MKARVIKQKNNFMYEIDGKVYFTSEERVGEGEFVRMKVRRVLDYDLYGVRVTKK